MCCPKDPIWLSHPCGAVPAFSNSSFWSDWREEMYSLASSLVTARPGAGLFLPHCSHHVNLYYQGESDSSTQDTHTYHNIQPLCADTS